MIMDLSKFDFFYVNGTSHSAAGGLEEPNIRMNGVMDLYYKKYNIKWKNRNEINYAKRLSDLIKKPFINDAVCGASNERIVRTTYDFIYKNWNKRDKFFIILETTDHYLSEVYLNEIKDYYLVTSQYNLNKNDYNFFGAYRDFWNKKVFEYDNSKQNIFDNWYKNHFNYDESVKINESKIIGLYSFCKLNNIKIFLMKNLEYYFIDVIDKNDIIKFSETNNTDSLHEWCNKNKFTIKDELDNESDDFHPGYFGHIEYANELYKFLL